MRHLLPVLVAVVLAAPSVAGATPDACADGSLDEAGFCVVTDAPTPAPHRGGPAAALEADIVMRGGGTGPTATPFTPDLPVVPLAGIVVKGGGTVD